MSEKMNHIFICDNCKKEEDVGFGSFPKTWNKFSLKTTNGYAYDESFIFCGDCHGGGWRDFEVEKKKVQRN